MRGDGGVFKRGRIWWFRYWHRGVKHQESANTTSKTEAGQKLREKLTSLASGTAVTGAKKYTVRMAMDAYLTNLALRKGELARHKAEVHAKPIEDALGEVRVADVRAETIDRFIQERLSMLKARGKGKVSKSTVNRETSLLGSALLFAHGRGHIARVAKITKLEEPPPRQGFWSSLHEFETFVEHLSDADLQDVAWCGFYTGWRRSEVFGLPWSFVDWDASPNPELRIPRTKNREPRVIPLVGKLRELFEVRWDRRKVTRSDGTTYLAALVFHRSGKRFTDPRVAWERALREAGLPKRTWHDFRRTAARNMVNAGVPEKVAMEITGHVTRSIFDRYHIVAQREKADALLKTMQYVAQEQPVTNVRPLRKGSRAE